MLRRRILPLVGRIGVRPQLSLVALVAILPLLTLLIVGVLKNRQVILEAATIRAQDLAKLGAERQDDSFKAAQNVLAVLRRLPQVSAASPEKCHATLQAIGADYPQFTSVGVVDAKGLDFCISILAKPMPFGDMDVFRATMAADPSAFVVGRFMIGPITRKPIVVIAEPLVSSAKDEPPPGIVYVSVDLNRAAQHAWDFTDRADATLSLIDTRAATILVRSSDQQLMAGKTLDGSLLVSAMLAHPAGGSVETVDVDGTARIFGFAPLITGGGSGLMVAVGLSRARVLAAADLRVMLGAAIVILTAVLAAGAAWFVGDRVQLRAIRSLLGTAQKLGAGDLCARAEMAAWQAPEFRSLAATLGEMAGGIERAQASLSANERQLRLLAENATDMILLINGDGQRLYASPACRALVGFEPEEMLAISSRQAIHPDDVGVLDNRRKWSDGAPTNSIYRMLRKDGSSVWVEAVSREIAAEAGQPPQRVVVVRDIELRVEAERRLKESESRYRLLAEHSTDMVVQIDRDLVRRYVSPACREVLGYEPEALTGAQPLVLVHPDDAERVAALLRSMLGGEQERAAVIYRIRHRDGRWIWVEAQLRAFDGPQGGAPAGVIGALRDISARKAAEDQLEEANRRLEALAGEDSLTGLANRRAFDNALVREHRKALCDRFSLAVVMIDVDRFKSFNDRYGHLAGDEALRQVSRAIESVIRRPADIAARYGGEEFAALLPDTDESGAAIIAERIRRAVLALAIEHDSNPIMAVTISAGVAAVAPNGFDASLVTLMRDADRALYRAKACGRNAIVRASALGEASADERSSAA